MNIDKKKMFRLGCYILLLLLGSTSEAFFTSDRNALSSARMWPATSLKQPENGRTFTITRMMMSSFFGPKTQRKGIKMPLFDLTSNMTDMMTDNIMSVEDTLIPLPADQMVEETRTLHMYGLSLSSPSHILMLEEAQNKCGGKLGHLVYRENDDSLVGGVGCAVDVLHINYNDEKKKNIAETLSGQADDVILSEDQLRAILAGEADGDDHDDDDILDSSSSSSDNKQQVLVLMRGAFRFVVREVISTIPYPTVLVDELPDESYNSSSSSSGGGDLEESDEQDDDDDDDDDPYGAVSIPAKELPSRVLEAMQATINIELEDDKPDPSPLEVAIMESSGMLTNSAEQTARLHAQEMSASFQVFRQELVEMMDVTDRNYAIGMMAAEIAELTLEERKNVLLTRDGIERLRLLLNSMQSKISLKRAQKLAQQLTTNKDEDEQELNVGKPEIPGWAKRLQEGDRIEYFWNEEYGWCAGTVRNKLQIVDEIVFTIEFDDGETHKIPMSGEDKIRWRPEFK